MNETPVADKSDDPPAQVDDLGLSEMFTKFVKQFLRRLSVIPGQHLCVPNCCLLTRRQQRTVVIVGNLGDQLFGQSLLPCQGKPGVQSEVTFILLRHLEPRQLGELHIDATARRCH
jgi:hypothetical protein